MAKNLYRIGDNKTFTADIKNLKKRGRLKLIPVTSIDPDSVYCVLTRYYEANDERFLIKQNRSKNSRSAVSRVIMHMQLNTYGATFAEVYDAHNGGLYAQVRRTIEGEIIITLFRDPVTNQIIRTAPPDVAE